MPFAPRAWVPAHVLALSLSAMELHDPAVPVLGLVEDSLLDPDDRAGCRTDRRLVFRRDALVVQIAVRPGELGRQLQVDVHPAPPCGLTVTALRADRGDPIPPVPLDATGHVDLGVSPGLVSLELAESARLAESAPDAVHTLRTAWVVV